MSKQHHSYNKGYIYALTCSASLGYAFWAYNFSIFDSLQSYIQTYIFPDASTNEISFIASSISLGAIFGALFSGAFISKWGRRKTMIISDIVGILSLGLTLVAKYEIMLLGRLLSGFIGGINNVVVALYLVEMSPLPIVGATGSLAVIILEIFSLISFGVGFWVPHKEQIGWKGETWRILYFFPALLCIIRLFCLMFVFKHDTPFSCLEKKNNEEAIEGLAKIFKKNIGEEYERVSSDVIAAKSKGSIQVKDLFRRKYKKAFLVCLLLAIADQLCGVSVFFVFSNDIFSQSTKNPVFYSTLFGVFNVVAVIMSFNLMNKIGRKKLITFGMIIISFLMLAFGLIAKIYGESHPILKYLILLWPFFYQASLGPLVFLYISEVLPDVGVGACISAGWATGFLISQFYLQSMEAFGLGVPFLFFAGTTFLCAVVFLKALVETKNKTKAGIIAEYNGGELKEQFLTSLNDSITSITTLET